MWRGRVHGAWFWGAVVIAVFGVIALSSGKDDAGSWAISFLTFVGVAYCLFRASQRAPGPPPED